MNKFYVLMFLSGFIYCSDDNGKLPSDFKFKDPVEYKEEVEEKRSSFMSQWKEYTEKIKDADVEVHIKSDIEVDIKSRIDEKGDIHITISEKSN